MRPFNEIVYGYGILLRVVALLLTAAQTGILIEAFRHRRSAAYRVFVVIQLAAGLLWFCALLDGSYTVDYAEGRVRSYPGFVSAIYHLPWAAIAAAELVFTALAVLCFIGVRRFRSSHLSQESVKETVDMLPVGVCFARCDGDVMLKNLRMDKICAALTGKALNDARALIEEVEGRGERSGDAVFLTDDSGSTVQFTIGRVTLEGSEYLLLLASDITEQYRITAELKAKNKKLIDIRLRMRALSEDAVELAMAEEILHARITVHDEVNHVLLSGRYYLDHPDTADGAQLIRTMQYTNSLLTREGEEPDAVRDAYVEALHAARAIGVDVSVSGEPPRTKSARELLGRAIRESAVNTVKHAEGDHLSVTLTREQGRLRAVLRGNGSAPAGPVAEAGGLRDLRRGIEAAGGEMAVSCEPQVTLNLLLPQEV